MSKVFSLLTHKARALVASSPAASPRAGAAEEPSDGILDLKDVLVRLYTALNPDKLPSVDKIFEDYVGSGRRDGLVGALRRKYGAQFDGAIEASNAEVRAQVTAVSAAADDAAAAVPDADAEDPAALSEAGEASLPSSFMSAMASDARGLMSGFKSFGDGVRSGGEAIHDGMRKRTTDFLESERLKGIQGKNKSRVDAMMRRVDIDRWEEMEPGRKALANRGAEYACAQARAVEQLAARNDAIFAGAAAVDASSKRVLPAMRARAAAWESFAAAAQTLPEMNERTKEVTCELEDVAALLRGLAAAVSNIEEQKRDKKHAEWEAEQWAGVEAHQQLKQGAHGVGAAEAVAAPTAAPTDDADPTVAPDAPAAVAPGDI